MAATRKLDASQLSMQAAARGQQGIQRAQEFAGEGANFRQSLSEDRRQFDLQQLNEQWERRRADRAQRDETRAKIQAGKADTTIFGGKGRADRDAAQQSRQQAAEAASAQKSATDTVVSEAAKDRELEAAKSGLKKAGPPSLRDRPPVKNAPPARDIQKVQGEGGRDEYVTGDVPAGQAAAGGAPMSPRAAALEQEMRQAGQRGDVQMGQALESTGAGGWVSDPDSPVTQAATAKAKASAFDMRAKRERLGMELTRAAATLRASKTKENKIEYERSRETNLIELAKWSNALKRIDASDLQKGERSGSIGDWNVFRQAESRAPVPAVKDGILILEALKTGVPNKEFMSWAVEGQGKLGLRYITIGEGLPDREFINLGSEAMQQFVTKIQELKALARTQEGGPNGLQSAKTLEARENMLYQTAARSILEGMPVASAAPAQAGGGGAEAGAEFGPQPLDAQPERAEELALPEEPQPGEGAPWSRGEAGMQQREMGAKQEAAEEPPAAGIPPEPVTHAKRLPPGATSGEPGRAHSGSTRALSPEQVGMERPRTDEEWAEYMRRAGISSEGEAPKKAPPKPKKKPSATEDIKAPKTEKAKAKSKKPKKKKSTASRDIKVPK